MCEDQSKFVYAMMTGDIAHLELVYDTYGGCVFFMHGDMAFNSLLNLHNFPDGLKSFKWFFETFRHHSKLDTTNYVFIACCNNQVHVLDYLRQHGVGLSDVRYLSSAVKTRNVHVIHYLLKQCTYNLEDVRDVAMGKISNYLFGFNDDNDEFQKRAREILTIIQGGGLCKDIYRTIFRYLL